jgi:hypothetical protein
LQDDRLTPPQTAARGLSQSGQVFQLNPNGSSAGAVLAAFGLIRRRRGNG